MQSFPCKSPQTLDNSPPQQLLLNTVVTTDSEIDQAANSFLQSLIDRFSRQSVPARSSAGPLTEYINENTEGPSFLTHYKRHGFIIPTTVQPWNPFQCHFHPHPLKVNPHCDNLTGTRSGTYTIDSYTLSTHPTWSIQRCDCTAFNLILHSIHSPTYEYLDADKPPSGPWARRSPNSSRLMCLPATIR